jgi:hypothetical protein
LVKNANVWNSISETWETNLKYWMKEWDLSISQWIEKKVKICLCSDRNGRELHKKSYRREEKKDWKSRFNIHCHQMIKKVTLHTSHSHTLILMKTVFPQSMNLDLSLSWKGYTLNKKW